MQPIRNISFYHFFTLPDPEALRQQLLQICSDLELKGTILLGHEGLNASLAGSVKQTKDFEKALFTLLPELKQILIKESFSDFIPFEQLKLKVKKEIVTMGTPEINPLTVPSDAAPHLPPAELKAWLDQGKDFLLMDTRNDYEFELGSFSSAEQLKIDNFRQFPEHAEQLRTHQGDRPMVVFCTGGIRCEKAAPFLATQGFKNVYQLDGGILSYFQECGGAHYRGECFVFDNRIALDPELRVSGAFLCTECQTPLPKNSKECTHCHTATVK